MGNLQNRISKFIFPLLLTVILLSGFAASTGMAQPKPLTEYDLPGLENTVSLTSLDPWDVVQLIEFLAHRGGLNNMVIGPGVAGLTTKLKFENVTVGEALEVVLSVNTLAYDWPLLTQKKSVNPIANDFPTFEATKTAAA